MFSRSTIVLFWQVLGTLCVILPLVLLSDNLPDGFPKWGGGLSMLLVIVSITVCTMSRRYRAMMFLPLPLILVVMSEILWRANPESDHLLLPFAPHVMLASFSAVFLLAMIDLYLNRRVAAEQ
jgi:hypothetical protein